MTATAKNNTNLDVELKAYPLNVSGARIPGVEITSTIVKAGAEQPIEMVMTGTVTHLDGIEYVAHTIAGQNQKILTPSDNIDLTNIRVRVTGYYEKEL